MAKSGLYQLAQLNLRSLEEFHKDLDDNLTNNQDKRTLVSVVEYREQLNDTKSSNEEIIARLEYLETLCRHSIQTELKNYVEKD